MALERWWALTTTSCICTEGSKSLVMVTPKSGQEETPRRLTPQRENENGTAGSANRKYNTQHFSMQMA